jgi:hypothetical protein
MNKSEVGKLIRVLAMHDPHTIALGLILATVIELAPDIPDTMLERIIVIPNPKPSEGLMTNAEDILRNWIDFATGE